MLPLKEGAPLSGFLSLIACLAGVLPYGGRGGGGGDKGCLRSVHLIGATLGFGVPPSALPLLSLIPVFTTNPQPSPDPAQPPVLSLLPMPRVGTAEPCLDPPSGPPSFQRGFRAPFAHLGSLMCKVRGQKQVREKGARGAPATVTDCKEKWPHHVGGPAS